MKIILFVDDEVNILSGFKRSLRKKRNEWLMLFAESGDQALAFFEQQPIDVLVTDMQMPGMTGDQLLEHVIEISPATARIVVTGYADLAKLAKASELAHRFLNKPCASEQLVEAIEDVLFSQQVVNSDRIREYMGHIGKLPSLPNVFHEVSEAIDSDQASVKQIASIIRKDGAMVAKVLQLANSPVFFGSGRLSSIEQAITRFGMAQLKQLVLQCSLFECFEPGKGAPDFMANSFWKYSLAVAELAKQISLAEGQTEDRPDQAYIAGLMHEMGYLILVEHSPDGFGELCELLDEDTRDTPIALEHQVLDVGHNEAGAYLLGLWNIPARVVEAVYYHHNPVLAGYRGMNALTCVHAAAAIIAPYPNSQWPFHTRLDTQYLAEVGVAEKLDDWRELAEPIMERFEQWTM